MIHKGRKGIPLLTVQKKHH